jgi:gamma-glutamyltranspeptidase/glutathione hydrolase
MAATLESIAATRGSSFYRGELAQAMVAHAKANGALHALSDFAEHTVDWVEPLALDFAATTVHEIPAEQARASRR